MNDLVEETMRREPIRTDIAHGNGLSRQEEHIVKRLATETETSESEARHTYQCERERLDRGARVKTYVSVIAARRARDTLRRKKR